MKIIKNNNKFILDFRFRDKRFRVVAFATENPSQELARTISKLIDIYSGNDVMPLELQRAIDCMPSRIVRKLGTIGLLSAARIAGKNRLSDHLSSFMDSLKIKGSTEKHLERIESRIKRICKTCGFTVISELDASRFTSFMNGQNMAVKTKRDYIATMKQFAQWLHDTGRMPKNNFKLIKNPKVLQSDQVHARRALTADEVARLIKAAETGETWRGISGAERSLIYRLAVESGLRYNEIATLKKSDFDFEAGTVEVRDANEKARRGAVLPLRKSTADEIKQFLSIKTPQAKAFTLKKGYMMMRFDLEAAKIEYEVDGKFADFHSLRHSTASLLIQTGANPKVIQSIMRHRDVNLTLSRYSHIYAGQQRETIESLPDFVVNQNKAVMTGTYDIAEQTNTEKNLPSKNCPKTANQRDKNRTILDNSCMIGTKGNSGFDGLNNEKPAFSGEKVTPSFSGRKWRRGDLNPRPVMFQDKLLHA